jgi:hypothetical protein
VSLWQHPAQAAGLKKCQITDDQHHRYAVFKVLLFSTTPSKGELYIGTTNRHHDVQRDLASLLTEYQAKA